MCQIVKEVKNYVAEEDIKCYKILYHGGQYVGSTNKYRESMRTLYRDFIIPKKILSGKGFLVPEEDIKQIQPSKGFCVTSELSKEYPEALLGGYIHSFKNERDAIVIATEYSEWLPVVVYECIIPKGATYTPGKTEIGVDSYASEKLKFVKVTRDYYNNYESAQISGLNK